MNVAKWFMAMIILGIWNQQSGSFYGCKGVWDIEKVEWPWRPKNLLGHGPLPKSHGSRW